MEKKYWLGHQGWTDYMSQFALYNHFIEKEPQYQHILLVKNPTQIKFVKRLFSHKKNIEIECLEITTEFQAKKTCVECHMEGNPICCPRSGNKCVFPSKKYTNLQGLCCFDNYESWTCTLNKNTDFTFVEAFYLHYKLPLSLLYKKFDVDIDLSEENTPQKPYGLLHDTQEVYIQKETLPNIPFYQLDKCCNDFFSVLPVLKEASVLHLIPSSYCMFVYLLQLKYRLFEKIPIFVHMNSRHYQTEYIGMYQHPKLDNWTFL